MALGVSGFLSESVEVAMFKMRQKGEVSSQLCQEIGVYFSPDAGSLNHVPAIHGRAAFVIFLSQKANVHRMILSLKKMPPILAT